MAVPQQEYDAVPSVSLSTTAEPNPPFHYHQRDARETAGIFLKFLSFVIVFLAVILYVLGIMTTDDTSSCANQYNSETSNCHASISLRGWGVMVLILDVVAVPLIASASTKYHSRAYAWIKTLSSIIYAIASLYGCIIVFGQTTRSAALLLLYFVAASLAYLLMLMYVEYHYCREIPTHPDEMNFHVDTAV